MLTYKAERENVVLEVFHDPFPPNPREAWDNVGTMICFHPRYNLGDEHHFTSPRDMLMDLVLFELDLDITDPENLDSMSNSNLLQIIETEEMVILPIYLLDHSGLAISTTPFGCPWDSGQIGWIYTAMNQAQETYGKVTRAEVKEALRAEVETYNQYLNNEVYGYSLWKQTVCNCCGNIEKQIEDSCSGIYLPNNPSNLDTLKATIASFLPPKHRSLAYAIQDQESNQRGSA